jgi:hypothetical protein
MNFTFEYVINSSKGRIFHSLNNGAVWALKLALLMAQIALFCILLGLSKLVVVAHPYTLMPYER